MTRVNPPPATGEIEDNLCKLVLVYVRYVSPMSSSVMQDNLCGEGGAVRLLPCPDRHLLSIYKVSGQKS